MKKNYLVVLSFFVLLLASCGVNSSNPTVDPTVTIPDGRPTTQKPTVEPTEETTQRPTEEKTPEPTDEIFTVKFVNYDGTVLYQTKALEGQLVLYLGETPTRPSEVKNGVRYYYEFDHWDGTAIVKGNMVRHAIFKSTTEKPMNNESKNEIVSYLMAHGRDEYHFVPIGENMKLGYDPEDGNFIMQNFFVDPSTVTSASTIMICRYNEKDMMMSFRATQEGVILLDVTYTIKVKNHLIGSMDVYKVNECLISGDLLETIMSINMLQTNALFSSTNQFLKDHGFSYIF